MAMTLLSSRFTLHARRSRQQGFTLIEVMISLVILVVGMVALLALFANTIATMHMAEQDMIAKQKAVAALESIFAARNDGQIGFAKINNVSNGGIFTDGPTALFQPGPDGIFGTNDDLATLEFVTLPGPGGTITGTAPPDVQIPLNNFQRTIVIGNFIDPGGTVNPNLRTIQVTVTYTAPPFPNRTYTVQSLISAFR